MATAYLINTDGTSSQHFLYYPKNSHDWLYQSKVIKADKDFSKVYIYLVYYNQTGTGYFDNFEFNKLSNLAESLVNSSFEIDNDGNGMPDNFLGTQLDASDGKSADYKKEGLYSFKIAGDLVKRKSARQRAFIGGKAKDKLVFSGYNKAVGSSASGNVAAAVYLNNTDGTTTLYVLYFPNLQHDWLYNSSVIEAKKDFTSADFYIVYYNQTGTAYFDDFKLRRSDSSQLLQQPSFELDSDIIDYTYDVNGNRYSKTVTASGSAAASRYYHYDASGNIVSETDKDNNVLVRYTRDTSGKAISMLQGSNTYYFVYNAHGDVTGLTDQNGNVAATYSYDEFGSLDTRNSTLDTVYNPSRYSGANNAYYDTETGLYKMGARYYQPDVGRWLTRDKYEGEQTATQSLNRYVYSLNNPTTYADPSGFKGEKITIDPGHGGKDPGAIVPQKYRAIYKASSEKTINRWVAGWLARYLKRSGYQIKITRSIRKDQSYISPAARAQKAEGTDMFVSIHQNSGPESAQGSEVLYHPNNRYGSKLLASITQKRLVALGLKNRGVVPRPNLAVLNGTMSMPSMLVESGFITARPGSPDFKLLSTKNGRKRIGDAIGNAIDTFFLNN
jgi:RHS repeat-associated protein